MLTHSLTLPVRPQETHQAQHQGISPNLASRGTSPTTERDVCARGRSAAASYACTSPRIEQRLTTRNRNAAASGGDA